MAEPAPKSSAMDSPPTSWHDIPGVQLLGCGSWWVLTRISTLVFPAEGGPQSLGGRQVQWEIEITARGENCSTSKAVKIKLLSARISEKGEELRMVAHPAPCVDADPCPSRGTLKDETRPALVQLFSPNLEGSPATTVFDIGSRPEDDQKDTLLQLSTYTRDGWTEDQLKIELPEPAIGELIVDDITMLSNLSWNETSNT